tara:strand:+ start:234 stop:350 length:117 start_codon:yes stop_codon:yes gene_type:complete
MTVIEQLKKITDKLDTLDAKLVEIGRRISTLKENLPNA